MVLFSFFRFRMHGCAAAGQRTHCASDAVGHLIPSLIHCLQTGGSPFPSLSNPKNPPGRAAYLQNSAGSVFINLQECSMRLRPLFLCKKAPSPAEKGRERLCFYRGVRSLPGDLAGYQNAAGRSMAQRVGDAAAVANDIQALVLAFQLFVYRNLHVVELHFHTI